MSLKLSHSRISIVLKFHYIETVSLNDNNEIYFLEKDQITSIYIIHIILFTFKFKTRETTSPRGNKLIL